MAGSDNELLPLESEVNFEKRYPKVLTETLSNYLEDVAQVQTDLLYGLIIFYCPQDERLSNDEDKFFGEAKSRRYTRMYKMKVTADDPTYIQTNSDVFSKFGFQVTDEMTFWISRREFRERLTGVDKRKNNDSRKNDVAPLIGDIYYVEMVNSIFEISWVEDHEQMIFGHRSFWKCIAKKYNPLATDNFQIEDIYKQSAERATVVSKINSAIVMAHTEQDEISEDDALDPTATGFDSASTTSINDDASEIAVNEIRKPGENNDILGDF